MTLRGETLARECYARPGVLSATWMAGLVTAFACELKLYPSSKGLSEIETCLDILHTMSSSWPTARHCHRVLSILLTDLYAQFDNDIVNSPCPSLSFQNEILTKESHHQRMTSQQPVATPQSHVSNGSETGQKRQKLNSSSKSFPHHSGSRNITPKPQMQHFIQTQYQQQQPHFAFAHQASGYGINNSTTEFDNPAQGPESELQWAKDPSTLALYPDVGDIFGQVSWDMLFQAGDGGVEGEGLGDQSNVTLY